MYLCEMPFFYDNQVSEVSVSSMCTLDGQYWYTQVPEGEVMLLGVLVIREGFMEVVWKEADSPAPVRSIPRGQCSPP